MPFKKENKAKKGRPSAEGGYSSLSKEEKAEYHLAKMRESRSKAPQPSTLTPEQPSLHTHRFSEQRDKLIVRWFSEDNYNQKPVHQIPELGENLSDAALASKSKYIMQQYNIALGMRLSYSA